MMVNVDDDKSVAAIVRRTARGKATPLAALHYAQAKIEKRESDVRAWSHVLSARAIGGFFICNFSAFRAEVFAIN
jgi:hypothetical protein